MNAHSRLELVFFAGLFLLICFLAFLVTQPFLGALAVAAIFAALMYPLHQHIAKVCRPRALSAFVTTLASFILLVVPLGTVLSLLVFEARSISMSLTTGDGLNGVLGVLIGRIEGIIAAFAPGFSIDIQALVKEGANLIASNLGSVFSGTIQFFLSFFIGCVAFYYCLKDGPSFIAGIVRLSPLSDAYDKLIFAKLLRTIRSVIQGSLMISVIQGVLTGVGFALFGVPNPVLWGAVTAIAAALPAIGPSLVILPGVAYLVYVGAIPMALGLIVWWLLVVGLVDNLLMPKLMSLGTPIHPLFILVSVLGGLGFFGPSGFLLGPLAFSLLYSMGEIYIDIIKGNVPPHPNT